MYLIWNAFFLKFRSLKKFVLSFVSVVNQAYKVIANILNAARGCTAVLQCSIPIFIKDFVKVVSWLQEPSFYIYPTLQGGKWSSKINFIFFKFLTLHIEISISTEKIYSII